MHGGGGEGGGVAGGSRGNSNIVEAVSVAKILISKLSDNNNKSKRRRRSGRGVSSQLSLLADQCLTGCGFQQGSIRIQPCPCTLSCNLVKVTDTTFASLSNEGGKQFSSASFWPPK